MAILITALFSSALFFLFFLRIAAFSNAQFDALAEDALLEKGHTSVKGSRAQTHLPRATKALPDRPSSPEKEFVIGLA